MKKFLFSAIAATTFLAAVVPVAQAAAENGAFDVTVKLVAKCKFESAGALNFNDYTALETAAQTRTAAIVFKCTRGLTTPSFAFDSAGGGADGVIAGLNYSLTMATPVIAAGDTAAPGTPGTPDTRTVTITGAMTGEQAGECATNLAGTGTSVASSCDVGVTTQTRTLIATY